MTLSRAFARRVPRLGLVSLTSVCLSGFGGPARADLLLVPDQYTTISEAVATAAPGDEVHVSSANSPYIELLTLVDAVTVRGGWSPDFSFQDTDAFETVIQRPPGQLESVVRAGAIGAGVVFEGFTITGGDSTFSGGGMFCDAGSAFTIANCKFIGNRATTTGGAIIFASGSSVQVTRCLFENNVAGTRGGGITIAAGASGVLIDFCTFNACSTGFFGGAMYVAAGARLERNRINNNVSATDGGGIYILGANVPAFGNLLVGNRAYGNGGGIYHSGGASEHRETLVENCVAGVDGIGNGGGIYFSGGSNRFINGFVRSNTANGNGVGSGLGGGIYFDQTTNGLVSDTEIVQNVSPVGGGIFIEGPSGGTWTFANVSQCTITENESVVTGAGGGIHAIGQDLGEILNNIIALQINGHGIASLNPASLNVRSNDVFSGSANTDTEYGGNLKDRTGINGNIRQNPDFCNLAAIPPDLALQIASPCLGGGENGADMGAHDATWSCGTVSIEETSWGKIKSLYR